MVRQRRWTFDPKAARRKLKPTTGDKLSLEQKALVLIAELKKAHIVPPPKKNQLNYIVDIGAKWRSRYFYFFSTYCCPDPNAMSPSFVVNVARMEWLGPNSFDLAFHRHTGEWITVGFNQSVKKCFNLVMTDSWFFN